MSSTVIKVENISKIYQLGEVNARTIAADLNRFWHKARGKDDPYLSISEENDRTKKATSKFVKALEDINFEIQQGDLVGIVGRNGAGKSTLFKILSRTVAPTTGSVKMKGRMASLLEVGTGFHPDLSGRDNIFLNGAIFGMRKKEIQKKFDEIVAFSEVERYIDTPVKRYSSGMYIRLAFAVAAHLDPEIMIIDEVLAVGDVEFQRKCIKKMHDVSVADGKTILFVSHNMGAIKNLCNKCIFLDKGKLLETGSTERIMELYNEMTREKIEVNVDAIEEVVEEVIEVPPPQEVIYEVEKDKVAQIRYLAVKNENGDVCGEFDLFDQKYIEVEYEINNAELLNVSLCIDVYNELGILLFRSFDVDDNEYLLQHRECGVFKAYIKLPNYLKAGAYKVTFEIAKLRVSPVDSKQEAISFIILENSIDTNFKSFSQSRLGLVRSEMVWDITKVN